MKPLTLLLNKYSIEVLNSNKKNFYNLELYIDSLLSNIEILETESESYKKEISDLSKNIEDSGKANIIDNTIL